MGRSTYVRTMCSVSVDRNDFFELIGDSDTDLAAWLTEKSQGVVVCILRGESDSYDDPGQVIDFKLQGLFEASDEDDASEGEKGKERKNEKMCETRYEDDIDGTAQFRRKQHSPAFWRDHATIYLEDETIASNGGRCTSNLKHITTKGYCFPVSFITVHTKTWSA